MKGQSRWPQYVSANSPLKSPPNGPMYNHLIPAMHAALPSRISRLWCWLTGQFLPADAPTVPTSQEAEPLPKVEIIAFPGTSDEPVAVTPAGVQVSPDELIQSLLETVQQSSLPVPSATRSTIYSIERARTLTSLQNLKQIPSLQSLARSFSLATHRDDASVTEVVEAVQKDPSLCLRVLRLANSVTISPVEHVNDIMTAVQLLGILRVRKAAYAIFTLRDAHTVATGFDWRHLWIHGLATAALAEELAKQLGLPDNSQLYLAGLFHDIGKIVLSTIAPEAYRTVLIDAWNGSERLEKLEAARLGVGHGEAGVIFAEHCKLHPEIIATIAHHADPTQATEHALTVALISVANFACKSYGLGFSGALLDEADGDFENLPAWTVIAPHCGSALDLETLEMNLREFIIQLKPELQSMRRGI